MQRLRFALMGLCTLCASCELEISRTYPRYDRDSRVMVATAASDTDTTTVEKKKKTCSPACKSPEVCVDGTCSLPASSTAPAKAPATTTAKAPPPLPLHSALAVVWVEESLQ